MERWAQASCIARLCIGLPLAACLGACMPQQHQVRSGTDPQYIDDDVRFRTTYYFRVFDYCEELNDTNNDGKRRAARVLNDSLYRFKMTGKASAATTKVRFEAGTLRAAEIDPFGADVEFDSETNRFRFKSRARTEEETVRKEVEEDIARLGKLQTEVLRPLWKDAHDAKVDSLIEERLDRLSHHLKRNNESPQQEPKPDERTDRLNHQPTQGEVMPVRSTAAFCESGQRRRGYQVFGPEGWRTFDQDERLILAMSTSGEPLVQTLRELADRVLGEQDGGGVPTHAILEERLRALRAQRALAEKQGIDAIDAALRELQP
jgi:hypothetical protein